MKMGILFAGIAVLAAPAAVISADDPPAVEALRNGFFVSKVDLDGRIVKTYLVDSRAQLCFYSDQVIPCENLQLREEWKDIISWTAD